MLIYVLRWQPSWISDRHKKHKFCRGPSNFYVFYADWKSKMAATAEHRLTLDPKGKCSNAFFSETTNSRSPHFEFHIGTKNVKFVEDHPMNIHVQFGFNHICSF
jgi:hypothetical protein